MSANTINHSGIKSPIFEFSELESPLPRIAVDYFKAQSEKFVLPEHVLGIDGFEQLCVLADDRGLTTYIGVEVKTYDTNRIQETLVYLLETENGQERIGHGEIRLGHTDDPYFENKPFVGFTHTEDALQRRGYGIRRLFAMDYLTRVLFDLRLNSSTTIQPEAESIWKKLFASGYVISYDEEGRLRYRFQ